MIVCRLQLRFMDPEEALRAAHAIAPDDPGVLELGRHGRTLSLRCAGATASGVLRSMDDVLGCLRAAFPEA